MTTLECKKCGVEKPLDQFGTFKNGDGPKYRRKTCNFCRVQMERERAQANPEKVAAQKKATYERMKASGYTKKYAREHYLKKTYGMTPEQWDEMFESQGHSCAICRSDQTSFSWCVDHDHEAGEVRGILCHGCNVLIGMAKDHPEVLDDAKRYLEERGYYGRYQLSLL